MEKEQKLKKCIREDEGERGAGKYYKKTGDREKM